MPRDFRGRHASAQRRSSSVHPHSAQYMPPRLSRLHPTEHLSTTTTLSPRRAKSSAHLRTARSSVPPCGAWQAQRSVLGVVAAVLVDIHGSLRSRVDILAGAVARKTTLRPQATGEPPNRRPWHSPCPASADPSSGRNGRIAPTTATQCARPSARGPSDKRRTSACGGTACGDATVGRQLAARACGGNASPSLLLLKYPRTCEHGQAGRWGAADCWGKRKRGRVRQH